jgi:hypothetical protein
MSIQGVGVEPGNQLTIGAYGTEARRHGGFSGALGSIRATS